MDDRRFMAKVTEGIHHPPDSHYELPLPRRDESLALPNNKKLAFHRLQHLKLRFGRDEKYKKEYTAFMNDIIRRDTLRRYRHSRKQGKMEGYGTSHIMESTTLKNETRSVSFSTCSAEYKGEALIKHLLQGPDLTSKLVEYYQGSDRNSLRPWQALKQCFCKFMSLNVIETYCASCGGRTAT